MSGNNDDKIRDVVRKNYSQIAKSGCGCGALLIDQLKEMLTKSGFNNIKISLAGKDRNILSKEYKGKNLGDFVSPALIEGIK